MYRDSISSVSHAYIFPAHVSGSDYYPRYYLLGEWSLDASWFQPLVMLSDAGLRCFFIDCSLKSGRNSIRLLILCLFNGGFRIVEIVITGVSSEYLKCSLRLLVKDIRLNAAKILSRSFAAMDYMRLEAILSSIMWWLKDIGVGRLLPHSDSDSRLTQSLNEDYVVRNSW